MTNVELANLLRKVAAAYQILNENRFKIIAYDRAADSIEHLTSDAKDLWDDEKLDEVPGVGPGIGSYLNELFKTGKVKHFDEVMKRVPEAVFPLLLVPGIGPKKAYRLVKEFGFKDAKTVVKELEKVAKDGRIAPLEGFGEKSEEVILSSIELFKKGAIKENRMELPIADAIAQDVMAHLKSLKSIERIDALGSLRRQVATIGDIDLAVATKKPEDAIKRFLEYPHQRIVDEGPRGATMLLNSGRQVDLRVQDPKKYGAMLQYFTGGKNHNIKLREYALSKGLSLNEYGIKNVKTGKVIDHPTEESFYKALGMPWIPPELREDKGEIEASIRGKLPNLVELSDIKGDLHMHTAYQFESSHDLGSDPLSAHLEKADSLGYKYIGISDHNPRTTERSASQIAQVMKKRYVAYKTMHEAWKKKTKKDVELFVMCEVDILADGKLALPKEAFEWVDGVVVSLHSSFTQPRDQVTKRVIDALTSDPKVRIFGHPTGRLLTKREGVDLDWRQIFEVCKKHDIALEINAYPQRLDLPDTIVYDAVKEGVKLCIDTDSHASDQMDMMKYGVSVARRGWATPGDIVDTMGYNEFKKWLGKSS